MGSNPTKGTSVDSSSIGRAPDCGFGGCEFDSRLSTQYREVAQFGRALGLGPRGRRFKSCLPYHAGVAQLGFDSCHQLHTKEIVSENKIVLYMLIIAILTGILYGKILAILYI